MTSVGKSPDFLVGIIGGTGLGAALRPENAKSHSIDTPFGKPSAPLMRARCEGVEIAFLARHGLEHTLPPSAVPYAANIFALKQIGCTHILASGATGSLREEFRPQELVIPDQLIDKTQRMRSFFREAGMAVHVEFSHPYCPTLRAALLAAQGEVATRVHDSGTYVCMEGPAFSTVAESRMHRGWGGDLIGMTAMPEAMLAREAEMCYASVALVTDYDCWRPHDPAKSQHEVLSEIMKNVHEATGHATALIRATLRRMAADRPPPCGCANCLDMAVWTQPAHIDPAVLRRLEPLLRRRFAHA